MAVGYEMTAATTGVACVVALTGNDSTFPCSFRIIMPCE